MAIPTPPPPLDTLEPTTRTVIEEKTRTIKALVKRTAEDLIVIGELLTDIKAHLNGHFGAWVEAELGWNERTAQRFMQVYRTFQDRPIVGFAPSALYVLAAPSTPEDARETALERAAKGETRRLPTRRPRRSFRSTSL